MHNIHLESYSDEPKETSDATGRDGQTFAPPLSHTFKGFLGHFYKRNRHYNNVDHTTEYKLRLGLKAGLT